MDDERRAAQLREFHRSHRRFFGRRVLDLACGGGILGFVLDERKHAYLGVDVNPDMIQAARTHARAVGSNRRFVQGDAARARIVGRFDTLVCIGNALGHIAPGHFLTVLRRLRPHAAPGAHFLIDYRDVVRLLFERKWKKLMVERREPRLVVSETTGCDTERGEIEKQIRSRGRESFGFTHAIWAPFLVETLMAANDFHLVKRRENAGFRSWTDVYRLEVSR
jgi:SAM-dependent methyltransferase